MLFAALGLGIAAPFLAIAYIKRLRAMLPRSVPWLVTFRRAMAVSMALTAVALGWLLWRQTWAAGLWIGLAAATLLLALLLLYSRRRAPHAFAGLATIAAAALVYPGSARLLPDDIQTALASTRPMGERFDPAHLAALRSAGTPIFLYFTADWCLTCKVNEATAIDRAETARLLAAKGVAVMAGDFTRRDPTIARFLADHGRSGVPLYLFYPAKPKPPRTATVTDNRNNPRRSGVIMTLSFSVAGSLAFRVDASVCII